MENHVFVTLLTQSGAITKSASDGTALTETIISNALCGLEFQVRSFLRHISAFITYLLTISVFYMRTGFDSSPKFRSFQRATPFVSIVC